MGTITDSLATTFRDFVTAGVASSGIHMPTKSDVRALGPVIEAAMATIGMGALVGVTKTTRALLDADLAHAADAVALVYADATDANNDLYIKVGASGAGSWTLTSVLHDIISSLAQPYVDAAEAAAADLAAARAAELKASLIAACGSAARISCLLTRDGTITYKSGTTVSEVDEIRPLLPEAGLKFGQHAVVWDGTGSPVAALAVRPVLTDTGLRFTRETNLTAKTDAGALTSAMPALSGNFSLTAVIRAPALTEYASVAAMNAAVGTARVGDMARVTGAANPVISGYDPIPTDCILSTDTGAIDNYWTGGLYVRGNAAWVRCITPVAVLFSWWDSTAAGTKLTRIGVDAAGRLLLYGYDGTTQVPDLSTWGAGADYWELARSGPVMLQIEKDADELILYVNGIEYATYHTALSFTPDRFNINGAPGTPTSPTVPISGISFTLDALLILNGCDYRTVLEAGNVLARIYGTPERQWSDTAYLAVVADQSRFSVAVGGRSSEVSTTPSIPDPVSNWAFILGQRGTSDFAISFPSRECIPGVFASETLTNSNRIGPIRCLANIYGTMLTAGSRTLNGSGTESIEWGFARELQRSGGMARSHLYFVGTTFGGYAEESLRAEHPTTYLFGLLASEISINTGTYPRTAGNKAILNVARRARKRGQKLLPLFVGNFQGETTTYVAGNEPIEGKLREDDLRNWWTNQIAKLCASDTPPPVLAAKSMMFSADATSNSYNTEGMYAKDSQFLAREANQDKDFRFILLASTGNWMGRGIHWEAVFQRLYGMIIGDRVRRAYCEHQLTGATKITSATVGTAANAGKIVLGVNRRLTLDAGGNPIMPGTFKTGGLNGPGYLSYGLIFESHATGTVTFSGVPADGETVTVGAQAYTFRTNARAAYEVEIADTAALCARNFLYALQGDGTAYTHHGAGTLASTVAFGTISGAVVRLFALAVGTAGNAVALAESSAAIAVSGATLTGADNTRAISGDVTYTNFARTAQIYVPISGSGPQIGDVIRVTGSGVLFSNFREETARAGYYPTQAWPSVPLADSSPTLDYSAASNLSDYLAPARMPVTA